MASELLALYVRVMGPSGMFLPIDSAEHTTFIVRVWDGMDGCWTDCTGEVDRDEALRVWADRTKNGTVATKYDDIDYYAIYPGDTRMHFDGSEGREMFR